jgi:hypothetical protein
MKRMTRMFLSIVLLAGLLWPCTTVYKNPTAVIDVNKTEVTPGTRLYFDGSNSHATGSSPAQAMMKTAIPLPITSGL